MPDLDFVFPEGSASSKWKWMISEEELKDDEEDDEDKEE